MFVKIAVFVFTCLFVRDSRQQRVQLAQGTVRGVEIPSPQVSLKLEIIRSSSTVPAFGSTFLQLVLQLVFVVVVIVVIAVVALLWLLL